MSVDCLMGPYGRYTLVCEALACFLQQTKLSEATLLIYNQHPRPLSFDHPRVRIVNEPPPPGSLRHIRHRMHELADPSAEFIHWWDDDDLYLPWHLEDCLTHIGTNVAWKPATSWLSEANVRYLKRFNTFEGSWIFRADYLKSAPLDTHPEYTDHPVTRQTQEAQMLAMTELGGRTSYVYRWDTDTQHLSGYGTGSEEKQRQHIYSWRKYSFDIPPPHGRLVPAEMTVRWQQYLDGIKDQVTLEEWEANRGGVGL